MRVNKWSPFTPGKTEPTRISRGKLDLFSECPRCFYLDRRLGIKRPSMPGWSLNSAVDNLLKNEFDGYRKRKEPHPLMKKYGIDAIPFQHDDMPIWRDRYRWSWYMRVLAFAYLVDCILLFKISIWFLAVGLYTSFLEKS
jgi:hypothetical protein